MTELTDKNIEEITKVAKETRENAIDMAKIASETCVDENADLEEVSIEDEEYYDPDIDNIASSIDEPMTNSEVSIFDVDTASGSQAALSIAKSNLELSEEDAVVMLDIIRNINTPNYSVFDHLPDSLKAIIISGLENNSTATTKNNKESFARAIIDEMIHDSGIEEAFIDLEDSLNQALNMPSIVDLYSEHTREVMEVKIPEMIERIKDAEPENAKRLEDIKNAFVESYTFSRAINSFNTASFIRKAVRRFDYEFKNSLRNFNYKNRESTFKMCDATEMPNALEMILISGPRTADEYNKKFNRPNPEITNRILDMNITDTDIKKFCILITKSAMQLDVSSISDSAYMYYLIKNIVVLKVANEGKTDFAIELINNICNVIAYIRDEEAKYESTNIHKPKHGKKLRK